MHSSTRRETLHEATVRAPAKAAYRLIADVSNWSWIYPTTVHAERVEGTASTDRIRIWTTTDGTFNHWVAIRRLNPQLLRVEYRQESAHPPVADMGGEWIIEAVSAEECLVRLVHDYRAVDDDPSNLDWIAAVLDRLSSDELAAFQVAAEMAAGRRDRLLTFTDTATFDGTRSEVYEFLRDPRYWVGSVADMVAVEVTRDTDGVQAVRTEVATGHGVHASELVRVCLIPSKIAYRHLTVPPLATVHTGEWVVEEHDGKVTVTARHTVVFDEQGIARVLGAGAGLDQAREFARRELGAGSVAVLEAAQRYAKDRR
ncbi:aromatase/cyclase [Micromonospora sp. LOL_023]|uniref:aromatase/cyclase n=1 Tax=Micromonospora sp. LOL_023 TaxID=3345418 RepID=UPI003A846941